MMKVLVFVDSKCFTKMQKDIKYKEFQIKNED